MKVLPNGATLQTNGPDPIYVFVCGYCLLDKKGFLVEEGTLFKPGETQRSFMSLSSSFLSGGIQGRTNPSIEEEIKADDLEDIGVFTIPPGSKYYQDQMNGLIISECLTWTGDLA